MVRKLTPALQKWLDDSMAIVRHIAHNYLRSGSAPKYLDEVELEAMAEIARWLNDWCEAGLPKPKWTPSTTARFAWGHALEKIRALFAGVMRTPTEWQSFDERRATFTGVNLDQFESEGEVFVSTDAEPSTQVSQEALAKDMAEALNSLPEDQAQAIRLFYFEGENKKAIAEKIGVSPHIVATLIDKGFASIRKLQGSLVNYL